MYALQRDVKNFCDRIMNSFYKSRWRYIRRPTCNVEDHYDISIEANSQTCSAAFFMLCALCAAIQARQSQKVHVKRPYIPRVWWGLCLREVGDESFEKNDVLDTPHGRGRWSYAGCVALLRKKAWAYRSYGDEEKLMTEAVHLSFGVGCLVAVSSPWHMLRCPGNRHAGLQGSEEWDVGVSGKDILNANDSLPWWHGGKTLANLQFKTALQL